MSKAKPVFRQIEPLDVSDDALKSFNNSLGVPAMIRPTQATRPAPKPQEKLTVELPSYVMDALRREAVDKRMSVRHLIMRAVQQLGIAVEEADMIVDGRRTHNRRKVA